MVIEGSIGPILIAIFIVLLGIGVYLLALPTILDDETYREWRKKLKN